jgi:hypothetical protein
MADSKRNDMFGNDLKTGDTVLYAVFSRSSSADMKLGVIINVTDKCVVIRELKPQGRWWSWSSGISRIVTSDNIVKYDGPTPDGWVTVKNNSPL